MEWYSGGVSGAIASCREKNALFIVYVYDESLDSRTTDEAWKTPEVCELLGANSYVALKVIKDSLEFRQFTQLFAVFMFPTVFCIGRTGKPLVIMNGVQSASQLISKLGEAFQKYQDEASGSSQSTVTETASQPASVATPTTTPPVSSTSPDGASGSSSAAAAPPQETKEEKLKHYQEKIKERRVEKEVDQFKREKQREIDRREQGRNVAKFKQQQEDQRTQNWIMERKKQKEEARLAREEIKAKLEQDKLERQAQKRMAVASEMNQPSQPGSSGVASVFSRVATSSTCRIQLRLSTGGTSVLQLNKSDSLKVLRDTVAKELDVRVSDVNLTSVYPRKELTADMDSQTLMELQLAPSGVVMVKVKKGMVASLSPTGGSGGGILGALMSLLQLIVSFLTFIKNAIVGLFSRGGQSGGGSGGQGSSYSQPERQRDRRDLRSGGSQPGSGDGLRVRKFRQEDYQDDSDEERSTYNGNSTQQQ